MAFILQGEGRAFFMDANQFKEITPGGEVMRSARFGFREETPECTTEHHGRHPVTGNVVDTVTWRCCACGAVTTIERVVNGAVTASKSTPCPCDTEEVRS